MRKIFLDEIQFDEIAENIPLVVNWMRDCAGKTVLCLYTLVNGFPSDARDITSARLDHRPCLIICGFLVVLSTGMNLSTLKSVGNGLDVSVCMNEIYGLVSV